MWSLSLVWGRESEWNLEDGGKGEVYVGIGAGWVFSGGWEVLEVVVCSCSDWDEGRGTRLFYDLQLLSSLLSFLFCAPVASVSLASSVVLSTGVSLGVSFFFAPLAEVWHFLGLEWNWCILFPCLVFSRWLLVRLFRGEWALGGNSC